MRKRLFSFLCALALLLIFISSVFSLASCRKNPSPYILMQEFSKAYGVDGTIFSPAVKEGDDGYANEDFFELIFRETPEYVSDYAVLFLSRLDRVGECALLLCYSDYDALVACDVLRRRVDLLKSMGASTDTSYVTNAVVFKSGKYAIMCALSDNERAERLWRKIL